MGPIELPALDGRDPLGFLAALGVLRLLAEDGHHVRLAYSTTTGIAALHGPYDDVDQVAEVLQDILERTDVTSVIPGAPADFPLSMGSGADPMRMRRKDFREYTEAVSSDMAATWLPCLVTDLAVDNNARTAISPYMAPSGKQSIRSFFTNPIDAVRANPATIREALLGWRRHNKFTGEYLDHRVLNSRADHPRGQKGEEHGVPGATWLATMALPLFRVTGAETGNTVHATGWHRPTGRRTPVMVWPLWKQPLTPHGIRVLLEHPALRPQHSPDGLTISNRSALTALGVFHLAAAERQTVEGRKFAGALAPTPICVTSPRQRTSTSTRQAVII